MIRLAERAANKSPFHRYKLGAVIVKGNRVMSTGYNEVRYSSETGHGTVHAEEAAIIKLLKEHRLHDLAESDIHVVRINRTGVLRMARPCARCDELIRSVGIRRVHYSTNDGVETYEC